MFSEAVLDCLRENGGTLSLTALSNDGRVKNARSAFPGTQFKTLLAGLSGIRIFCGDTLTTQDSVALSSAGQSHDSPSTKAGGKISAPLLASVPPAKPAAVSVASAPVLPIPSVPPAKPAAVSVASAPLQPIPSVLLTKPVAVPVAPAPALPIPSLLPAGATYAGMLAHQDPARDSYLDEADGVDALAVRFGNLHAAGGVAGMRTSGSGALPAALMQMIGPRSLEEGGDAADLESLDALPALGTPAATPRSVSLTEALLSHRDSRASAAGGGGPGGGVGLRSVLDAGCSLATVAGGADAFPEAALFGSLMADDDATVTDPVPLYLNVHEPFCFVTVGVQVRG
jgi:hypothetical protein